MFSTCVSRPDWQVEALCSRPVSPGQTGRWRPYVLDLCLQVRLAGGGLMFSTCLQARLAGGGIMFSTCLFLYLLQTCEQLLGKCQRFY